MKVKFENIIPMIDRGTHNWQIGMLLGFALLGGILFFAAVCTGGEQIDADLERLSDSTMRVIAGLMSFCLFFPLAYILLLIKESARSRRRIDELAKKIDAMKAQKSSAADG